MMTSELARDIYYRLEKVRLVEEAIAAEYPRQEMRCPVHLSIGQEAVAVGVSVCLEKADVVFSTHRCHSHYLAKGGDLNAMIAELYGKRSGCAAGLGGSMHLVDERVGMMGASAIVGGSIPLATGAGLHFQMSGLKNVAVPFFGDGAAEEGVFHESMNFAALKNLPVVFVCENNGVATSSRLLARRPQDTIYRHGEVFGIPGVQVDGNDVIAVYEAAKSAVDRARNGGGAGLIEAKTFRMMRHVGPEADTQTGGRTQDEWNEWAAKCPVRRFEKHCNKHNLLTPDQCQAIRDGIKREIAQAFEFAKAGEYAEWI
jgi:pyruvate dehydrogenase E1 component alpha subunit